MLAAIIGWYVLFSGILDMVAAFVAKETSELWWLNLVVGVVLEHVVELVCDTTGEAADVCKVSQQTIIRCFDSGRLGGFRVPGSKFRRIPRADLIKFMRATGHEPRIVALEPVAPT